MPSIIENPPKVAGRMFVPKYIQKDVRDRSKNTYWETELPKFTRFYTVHPPFRGGWLRTQVKVERYDDVSMLESAHIGLDVSITQLREYTPPAFRETRDGVRQYTARSKRRFVGITIKTEDLSTLKPREVKSHFDDDALISEFDEFNAVEDSDSDPDHGIGAPPSEGDSL